MKWWKGHGNSTFAPAYVVSPSVPINSKIILMDVNNDGYADLVSCNNVGPANQYLVWCLHSLLASQPSSPYQPQFWQENMKDTTFGAPNYIASLAVLWCAKGDVDGDNLPDILVTLATAGDWPPNRVRALLLWRASVLSARSFKLCSFRASPHRRAQLSWFKNNGDNTFTESILLTQGMNNARPLVADLNNDGERTGAHGAPSTHYFLLSSF